MNRRARDDAQLRSHWRRRASEDGDAALAARRPPALRCAGLTPEAAAEALGIRPVRLGSPEPADAAEAGDADAVPPPVNPLADPWTRERLVDPRWPVEAPSHVQCVTDASWTEAVRVAGVLRRLAREGHVFACDTEVADIDVTRQSPVGHGRVICFSVHAGPGVDFGPPAVEGGPAPGAPGGRPVRDTLWVDTSGAKREDIFRAFRPFWESADAPKVWHNYGFDRHVLENEVVDGRPLKLAGFAGDTLHMARLLDTSRASFRLDDLTADPALMPPGFPSKTNMRGIFERPRLKKDGTPGKAKWMPGVDALQEDPLTRGRWIEYSALDAEATWALRHGLQGHLLDQPALGDVDPALLTCPPLSELVTMWDVYDKLWRPFGELLTDMESAGFLVDREHLRGAETDARRHAARAEDAFRAWAKEWAPGAQWMNARSNTQIQQLLFGSVREPKGGRPAMPEPVKSFKVDNEWGLMRDGQKRPTKFWEVELDTVWGTDAKGAVLLPPPALPTAFTPSGAPQAGTPVLRGYAGKAGKALALLAERYPDSAVLAARRGPKSEAGDTEIAPIADDDSGSDDLLGDLLEDGEAVEGVPLSEVAAAAVSGSSSSPPPPLSSQSSSSDEAEGADGPLTRPGLGRAWHDLKPAQRAALQAEAARDGIGRLYAAAGGGRAGLEACAAVDQLCEVSAVDTLLSNFIVPLQGDDISTPDGRVHCSLNLNTETGRLSARRPNLQNQPALEKDRYGVRKAFKADVGKGHTLIVADYGQLELRLLAHMAGCASMIEAFHLGGDFHSRTALSMYDTIQAAVDREEVLLEWDGGATGQEEAPLPLIKDVFASERRKAKILNFSLAY